MRIGDALSGVHRVFLDTAPVIYFVEVNPTYIPLVDVVFHEIESGRITAVTSSITLVECLVGSIRIGAKNLSKEYDLRITSGSNTEFVSIDAEISRRAAEYRALRNLGLADSLQVAASIQSGCDAFLTNDQGFSRVSDIPILVLDDLTL